jgi:hypothetical protein
VYVYLAEFGNVVAVSEILTGPFTWGLKFITALSGEGVSPFVQEFVWPMVGSTDLDLVPANQSLNVFRYRFSHLCVFLRRPFACVSVVRVQILRPPVAALFISSTRNQAGNSDPIVAVFPCRISQLCIFLRCPFTLDASQMCGPLVDDGGVKILDPSVATLSIRSTRNQRRKSDPIVAEFRHRINQLCDNVIIHLWRH